MPDDPHPETYWKDESSAFVRENLEPTIELLQQLTNYGSHLVPRAWGSSSRQITDSVLIASLLKHSLAMMDSVTILLGSGSIVPAFLPLRSLYEAHAYMRWIVAADTDDRAALYFVWHIRQELEWTRAALAGSPENTRLQQNLNTATNQDNLAAFAGVQAEIATQEANLIATLNSPTFTAANALLEAARTNRDGTRKNKDVSWYVPTGVNTFRDMCVGLGLLNEYVIFYSADSEVMHATTQRQMISHNSGSLVFEPIRNPKEFHRAAVRCVTMALRIFRIILERYRPGEVEAFNRRYVEEWRQPFHSIPEVRTDGGVFRTI